MTIPFMDVKGFLKNPNDQQLAVKMRTNIERSFTYMQDIISVLNKIADDNNNVNQAAAKQMLDNGVVKTLENVAEKAPTEIKKAGYEQSEYHSIGLKGYVERAFDIAEQDFDENSLNVGLPVIAAIFSNAGLANEVDSVVAERYTQFGNSDIAEKMNNVDLKSMEAVTQNVIKEMRNFTIDVIVPSEVVNMVYEDFYNLLHTPISEQRNKILSEMAIRSEYSEDYAVELINQLSKQPLEQKEQLMKAMSSPAFQSINNLDPKTVQAIATEMKNTFKQSQNSERLLAGMSAAVVTNQLENESVLNHEEYIVNPNYNAEITDNMLSVYLISNGEIEDRESSKKIDSNELNELMQNNFNRMQEQLLLENSKHNEVKKKSSVIMRPDDKLRTLRPD